MEHSLHQPSGPETVPFVIEHLRLQETRTGFVPGARLLVTPNLRTSGLLRVLPEEGAKLLLTLLTFLTPNGHIHPSVPEVAAALGTSEKKAHDSLRRLATRLQWQGEPLVREVPGEGGLNRYCLSRAILAEQQTDATTAALNLPLPPPLPAVSDAATIIAHSREHYAVPRAEAERMVAAQLGHAPEETADTPEGEVHRRLTALGVMRDTIVRLLTTYQLEDIQQQLDWLPYRNAKSPARFVVAAVEGGYAAPPTLPSFHQPRSAATPTSEAIGFPPPEISLGPNYDHE